jgi:hypothetical protein
MTPIHRIPRDGDTTLTQTIDTEGPHPMPGDALAHLVDHTGDQQAINTTLDWAMQLRDETGRDWGECISTAMTMFFG